MTKIQGLSSDQLKKIVNIIHTHLPNVHIFAFGSRITGTPRKYSDFDIALDNGHPIDLSKLTKIKNTLSETDLRSEEHTSELQSQFHLLCHLLFLKNII